MKMGDILWQALADAYIKGAQDVHDCTKLIDWKAEAGPIAAECRNQIIQELMEKAETERKNLETKHSRIGHIRVERDVVGRTMLEREINALWRTDKWLKSQMEGGE